MSTSETEKKSGGSATTTCEIVDWKSETNVHAPPPRRVLLDRLDVSPRPMPLQTSFSATISCDTNTTSGTISGCQSRVYHPSNPPAHPRPNPPRARLPTLPLVGGQAQPPETRTGLSRQAGRRTRFCGAGEGPRPGQAATSPGAHR